MIDKWASQLQVSDGKGTGRSSDQRVRFLEKSTFTEYHSVCDTCIRSSRAFGVWRWRDVGRGGEQEQEEEKEETVEDRSHR